MEQSLQVGRRLGHEVPLDVDDDVDAPHRVVDVLRTARDHGHEVRDRRMGGEIEIRRVRSRAADGIDGEEARRSATDLGHVEHDGRGKGRHRYANSRCHQKPADARSDRTTASWRARIEYPEWG